MTDLQYSIDATVNEINRLRTSGVNTRVLEIHLQSLLSEKTKQDIESRKGQKANNQ